MEHLILVFNCGSSSLKGAVINYKTGQILITYLAEKLNLPDAFLHIRFEGQQTTVDLSHSPSHESAIEILMQDLQRKNFNQLIRAIGHRVVHGGEIFKDSIVVTEEVIKNIEACQSLAPLHNYANLIGIQVAKKVFHDIPQVAVFDTAYHQTMSETTYLYGIPYDYYRAYKVRKYGMHGTSYRYVSDVAKQFLARYNIVANHMIIAHLGNGASLCAVKDGQSVDTTMGLTPLEGLIMGTRSGDIDPSIFSFLHDNAMMDIKETTDLLNKKSGLLGISGISSDVRLITEAAEQGHKRSRLAIDMFNYRIAKLAAGMAVALGKIDAFVFTGGIGENSSLVRHGVLEQLKLFGLMIDEQANLSAQSGEISVISTNNTTSILIVPTNEELMIAKDTAVLVGLSE